MQFAYLATLPLINLPTDGTRQNNHFVKGMDLLARFINPYFNH